MSYNNCQRGSRIACSLSKAAAVPGAPAFHPYPLLILLSVSQGKGKQPPEHPALQPGARHCNHKPCAKSSLCANDLSQRKVWPPAPATVWLIVHTHYVREVHSSFAPLISLIFTDTIISCRLIIQAFSPVLVKINFLERHSAGKTFWNIILWWSVFRNEILGGHSILLLVLSGFKSCFLFYILT